MQMPIEDGWIDLSAAIINAAVCDYVTAKRVLDVDPDCNWARKEWYKNYQFFKGEWFGVLSLDMDVSWVLGALEEIVKSGEDVHNFTLDLRNRKFQRKVKKPKGGITWESTKIWRGV